MSSKQSATVPIDDIDLWYTRCPVPTASGVAYQLGWFDDVFEPWGRTFGILQDAPRHISQHHFDHRLPGLLREGGNVPAIVARSDGAPTWVIGLTWIEEWQTILVRDDSPYRSVADLRGARIAVPTFAQTNDASHSRAMALHGFHSALALGDLTLDDVKHVDVEVGDVEAPATGKPGGRAWRLTELDLLADGQVDAIYVKGAHAAERATAVGARVLVNLDDLPDRRRRVNNGTPRPITVHDDLLQQQPDVVVHFLAKSLEASNWAAANRDDAARLLGRDTVSGIAGIEAAYGPEFHRRLAPDLSAERVALLGQQKDFLGAHEFLGADFDIESWIAYEPIARAQELVGATSGASSSTAERTN